MVDFREPGLGQATRRCLNGARLLTAIALPLLVVLVGGCGQAVRQSVRTEFQPFSEEDKARWDAAQDARYRLRVGDVFTVDFKYQDELDRAHILILPDGSFSIPGLESVRAAGLTVSELDSLITSHFARDYRNPELSLIVEMLAAPKVYVLGEVKLPGLYEMPPNSEGVLQAIALAGGFNPHAQASETVIIRVTKDGYLYRHCDLSHLEKNVLKGTDYLNVQPYDIVYVPRTAIGDLALFTESVLPAITNLSQLFWDAYAIDNLDKISNIIR